MSEKFPKKEKASVETLPTKMSAESEPGIERARKDAYDKVGVLRERVRINEAMPLDAKSELLEQLHEIQKGLSRGTVEIENALVDARALANEFKFEF